MNRCLLTVLILWIFSGVAVAQDALSVDRSVPGDVATFFENEDDMDPQRSDFKIVNYVLLSSESGARWAVVALKNTATGSRIFQENQLMALFANGERHPPLKHRRSFKSLETISLTVSFGEHVFPILTIYTRN